MHFENGSIFVEVLHSVWNLIGEIRFRIFFRSVRFLFGGSAKTRRHGYDEYMSRYFEPNNQFIITLFYSVPYKVLVKIIYSID